MDFQTPNTLAEQIANYLAERVMTGEIKPGERLHEATIAGELDVSRASVKEALYTLTRWHLVEITPRKGARATQLDATYASELYDIYMHLLIMLARRLCERWEEADRAPMLETIKRVTGQLYARPPDILAVVQASFEVLDQCADVVGNPYLSETLANFKPAVSRTYYVCADRYQQDLDRTAAFFARLTEAVLARDADAAEAQIVGFAEHQKALIRQALDATS